MDHETEQCQDDSGAAGNPNGIRILQGVRAQPAADVANDDIVRRNVEQVILQADAVARRSLSGDREARFLKRQGGEQPDVSGDAKQDGARVGGGVDRLTQRPGPLSFQVGHVVHVPSAPPGCGRPCPSAPGKAGSGAWTGTDPRSSNNQMKTQVGGCPGAYRVVWHSHWSPIQGRSSR